MIEYGIFKEESRFFLITIVNEKIKEGWKPSGGAFVARAGHSTYVSFYQAMVRENNDQKSIIPNTPIDSGLVAIPFMEEIKSVLDCSLKYAPHDFTAGELGVGGNSPQNILSRMENWLEHAKSQKRT